MQNLTTSEPDDGMIEVAIAAVEAVFDWKAYLRENFPETELSGERFGQTEKTVSAGSEEEKGQESGGKEPGPGKP